ncbi:MAG: Na+/H+ antiporter subunit E [Bacteroidales bacterium]|nr:Na+/H+ antiporter subunit E [Bacteroidales bacterium]
MAKVISTILAIPGFMAFYLYKLVQANVQVAVRILSPNMQVSPGMVVFNAKADNDAQLLLFSNLVSMTPGSLSADISPDKKQVLIHVLYFKDERTLQNEFSDLFNRVKKIV